MSRPLPFVRMEFTDALGPAPGRYPVGRAGDTVTAGSVDVLTFSVVKGPVSLLHATFIQATHPLDAPRGFLDRCRSQSTLREGLVEQALAAVNLAIRAHRAAARDPYLAEILRTDPREVIVGFGDAADLYEGRFTDAVPARPPRGPSLSRAEKLMPADAVAGALSKRFDLLEAEELLLRALLDIEQGRQRSACLQASACVELLVAELRAAGDAESEQAAADLAVRRGAALGLAHQALAEGELGDASRQELTSILDAVEDALEAWRGQRSERLATGKSKNVSG